MNSRDNVNFKIMAGMSPDIEEKTLHYLVTLLIEALYIPVLEDGVSKRDPVRTALFGIADDEPINWGDLKCSEFGKLGDTFLVVIDEASPDACPTFCAYIEKYMKRWGWDVRVKTEW